MSYLLRFAYWESMGLWILPYSLAGLFLAAMAGRHVEGSRLASVAFLCAFDAARLALAPPACRPSTDGCIPPDGAEVVLVLPFLIQWALLYLVLVVANVGWRATTAQRQRRTEGKRAP